MIVSDRFCTSHDARASGCLWGIREQGVGTKPETPVLEGRHSLQQASLGDTQSNPSDTGSVL